MASHNKLRLLFSLSFCSDNTLNIILFSIHSFNMRLCNKFKKQWTILMWCRNGITNKSFCHRYSEIIKFNSIENLSNKNRWAIKINAKLCSSTKNTTHKSTSFNRWYFRSSQSKRVSNSFETLLVWKLPVLVSFNWTTRQLSKQFAISNSKFFKRHQSSCASKWSF